MRDQFAQELREELNLSPMPHKCVHIGSYENIRPDGPNLPGWHWVIHVMAMRVVTLEGFINKEPHKHDVVEKVNILQDWILCRTWAPRLGEYLIENRRVITQACHSIL